MSKEKETEESFIKREAEARTIKIDIGRLETVAECESASYKIEIPSLNAKTVVSLVTIDEHEEDMWMDHFVNSIRGLDKENLVKSILIKYDTRLDKNADFIFIETEETNEDPEIKIERFECVKTKGVGGHWQCGEVSEETEEILKQLIREGKWL